MNFKAKLAELWGKLKQAKKSKKIMIAAATVVLVIIIAAVIVCSQTIWKIKRADSIAANSTLSGPFRQTMMDSVETAEEAVAEIELEEEEARKKAEEKRKQEAERKALLKNVDIEVMKSDDVKNILLIGQDKRSYESEAQRSDSMIIASLNKKTKEITLCSLMRDMYVPIPGYKDNRINEAYSFGGMELLDQVIEESLGVHIDGNVEVDFNGFKEIFSVLGPIEIDIQSYEVKYLNNVDKNWDIKEGINYLTAEQALAYARCRKVGNSDWERTDRQRRVLTKAFENVKGMDLKELLGLASTVCKYLTTDLTTNEMLGYAYTVATEKMTMGESHRFPVEGTYKCQTLRKGMEVLVPNLEENAKLLKEYLYGEDK